MKIFLYSLSLLALSVLIVSFLWFSADRPNKNANHFQRTFIDKDQGTTQRQILPEGVSDFIGVTSDTAFFSTEELGKVIMTNSKFEIKSEIRFPFSHSLKDSIGSDFFSRFDVPWIYFCAYNIPAIIRCNIYTRQVDVYYKSGTAFTNFCPVSANKFLFRQLDFKTKDQIFSLRDIRYSSPVTEKTLYTPYGDGGLVAGGNLHYQKDAGIFNYTFIFGNKIILFDTSLNIVKTLHTIDTFALPLMRVGLIGKNTYSNLGPSKRINHLTCISSKFLFVNSLVKADNEEEQSFSKNAVIDVYDLTTLIYKGSFYIHRPDHKYISNMLVVDRLFIAIYKDEAIVRSLEFLN